MPRNRSEVIRLIPFLSHEIHSRRNCSGANPPFMLLESDVVFLDQTTGVTSYLPAHPICATRAGVNSNRKGDSCEN
jgi:hypothetical protein